MNATDFITSDTFDRRQIVDNIIKAVFEAQNTKLAELIETVRQARVKVQN